MADEAPTTSHSGLARVFKGRKSRRDGSDINTSTNSLASNDTAGDESSGIRSSIEGALDKFKDRARKSSDDRRDSIDSPRRMSTLLTGKARRQRKQEQQLQQLQQQQQAEGLQEVRGNDIAVDDGISGLDAVNPSEESFGASKSDASSLLTEDSDVEP